MKYELTDETMEFDGKTLHRIKALKDFGNVKCGDIGGWVESESNLSQEGDCWIFNDAKVHGDAYVAVMLGYLAMLRYRNAWGI